MFQVPSNVVVRRPISLNGAIVPAGTSLSQEQVEALGRNLNALLDSGYVVATPDPFARKGKARPTPSSLPPVIRDAMIKKIAPQVPIQLSATVVGDAISCEITGGLMPFTVTLKDEDAKVLDVQTGSKRTFAFTGLADGNYIVVAQDPSGGDVFKTVSIQAKSEPKKPRKKDEEEE
jgi:hypothetical protein